MTTAPKPNPLTDYFQPVQPYKDFNPFAAGFLDPRYYQITGAVHPGVDFNGNKGGDTDLGLPVNSIHLGVVTAVGFYPVWGHVVLVQHPGVGVWSQYAHLLDTAVEVGQRVYGGQKLGRIGKGDPDNDPLLLAHLHFEVRYRDVRPEDWPSYGRSRAQAEAYTKATRLNPLVFLKAKAAWETLNGLVVPPGFAA